MSPFAPYATMKAVAKIAGEPPTDHPRTACEAAARFINSAEITMSNAAQRKLRALVPELIDTRTPDATHARLTYLADRSIRKWTAEALRAVGKTGIAQVIEQEPSLTRAAALAEEMAQNLRTAESKRLRTTGDVASTAAKAVRLLSDPDETLRNQAAERSASTTYAWSIVTRKNMTTEVIETVRAMLAIIPVRTG